MDQLHGSQKTFKKRVGNCTITDVPEKIKIRKKGNILNMCPKSIIKSWTNADKYIISQDPIVLIEKRDNSLLPHLYIIVNHMKNIHCAIIMCQAYARGLR